MNRDAGRVKGTNREVPREFHQLGAITSLRLKGKEKKGILVPEPPFLLDASHWPNLKSPARVPRRMPFSGVSLLGLRTHGGE